MAIEGVSPTFPALRSGAGRVIPLPLDRPEFAHSPPALGEGQKSMCASPSALFEKAKIMETARCPSGLPGYGYSMQAAAIASALVERKNAHIYRGRIRDWLNRFEDPGRLPFEDMDDGRVFAEFLTDLCRVGAGLNPD